MAETGFEVRLMTRMERRPGRALAPLIGLIVWCLASSHARAQFDMGMGWGWGGFGMRNVPSPQDFLNQHALTRAGGGMQARPSHSPYSNNPNSYFNRVRDNGFVSHFDARRRRPPSSQSQPAGNAGRGEAGASAGTVERRPVAPLESFFDAARRLVWPNEAPTTGDLKEKRDRADQASLSVLEETKRQTMASLSSVTDARHKLIEYGRPAVQEIQTQATSAIADAFHRFLLSLYDSLAQAAWPADAKGGTAGHP
jgi:hypothetical protein